MTNVDPLPQLFWSETGVFNFPFLMDNLNLAVIVLGPPPSVVAWHLFISCLKDGQVAISDQWHVFAGGMIYCVVLQAPNSSKLSSDSRITRGLGQNLVLRVQHQISATFNAVRTCSTRAWCPPTKRGYGRFLALYFASHYQSLWHHKWNSAICNRTPETVDRLISSRKIPLSKVKTRSTGVLDESYFVVCQSFLFFCLTLPERLRGLVGVLPFKPCIVKKTSCYSALVSALLIRDEKCYL